MTPFLLFALTIGFFYHSEPTFPQPQDVGKETIEKIRRGEEPPILVMRGMGFDFQAEESERARAAYFAAHEKVDGKWIPKTLTPAIVPASPILSVPINDPHQLCGSNSCRPLDEVQP